MAKKKLKRTIDALDEKIPPELPPFMPKHVHTVSCEVNHL